MIITELTESDFPLWMIETKRIDGTWQRFTIEPFRNEENARWHIR